MKYNYNTNYDKIFHCDVQKYLDKMNNGDKEARINIIHHYANTVKKIIDNNFNNVSYSKNDLFDIGFIELLNILNIHSHKGCLVISNNINYHVKKKISDYIKEKENEKNSVPKNNFKTIDELIADKEHLNIISQILNDLSETDRKSVYLYFFENYSKEEIAKILNLSRQRIYQKIDESLAYIKEQIFLRTIDFSNHKNAINIFKKHLNEDKDKDIINSIGSDIDNNLLIILNNFPNKVKNVMYLYLYGSYSTQRIAEIYNINNNEANKIIEKDIILIKQHIFFKSSNKYSNNNIILNFGKFLPNKNKAKIIQYLNENNGLSIIFKTVKKFNIIEKNIMYLYLYQNYTTEQISYIYNLDINTTQEIIYDSIEIIKQKIYNLMNKKNKVLLKK